ncbi:hypothetical protein Fot_28809 [Forsythia ovata]|uniref:Uncharacterized protein n=1 Tax=Forsythia ovata TaxID=205694 RepID=A0ABD1TQI1_9LAMI
MIGDRLKQSANFGRYDFMMEKLKTPEVIMTLVNGFKRKFPTSSNKAHIFGGGIKKSGGKVSIFKMTIVFRALRMKWVDQYWHESEQGTMEVGRQNSKRFLQMSSEKAISADGFEG